MTGIRKVSEILNVLFPIWMMLQTVAFPEEGSLRVAVD